MRSNLRAAVLIGSAVLAAPVAKAADPIKPGAPVSMPIRWRELNKSLSADKYTIKNAVARMNRLGDDPCLSVLQEKTDLVRVLANLSTRFAAKAGTPE